MHEVLVNRLGGLSLPRKSVVRLTDRPDMTLDVYRGRKTTMQCNAMHTALTLKCLSIGMPKIINFPFVSNGKFMVFTCPNIHAHYNEAVLCLNFWDT